MRPNSKTYNTDFGSSFQKSSYRTFQPKSRANDVDRWDHAGFDQLQTEYQDKSSKSLAKSRRNFTDNTMAADYLGSSNNNRGPVYEKTKWVHDRYQETVDDIPQAEMKEESGRKEITQEQRPKKERKPDRQLYSVRQKYGMKNDDMNKVKETTLQCSERLNCSVIEKKEDSSPYLKGVKEVLKAFDDKDFHSPEEDKLSISNVSTTISDPLKSWEEESYLKNELFKERVESTSDITQSPKNKKASDALLEVVLETENGTINLRIYHGEDDFEGLLDNVCSASSFDARTGLYFKINIMQMIKEAGIDNEKVNVAFNKLLEINYKILMFESGFCEADDSISQYLHSEARDNEPFLGYLEDSY